MFILQAFTGMSKDELMKYANDPFWVRLRWIFFILFWAVWAAMLLGAVLISLARAGSWAVIHLLRAIGDISLLGIDDRRIFDVAEGFQRHAALVLSL